MGIGIYSGNYTVKEYQIKNSDGTVAGTIRIKKSTKRKPKRLHYNFKYISTKILTSTTSNNAGKAAITARMTVSSLYKKLKTGMFDDREVEMAIIHAKKMERIAHKRMKHLREEEQAEKQGSCQEELEEKELSNRKGSQQDHELRVSREALEKLMEELEELMKDAMVKAAEQDEFYRLADELTGNIQRDMEPHELERLKKKHRADELMAIAEADRKYLIAFFSKLQKEKEEAVKGNCSYNDGISLEISGTEMPVFLPDVPMNTGESIDLSV